MQAMLWSLENISVAFGDFDKRMCVSRTSQENDSSKGREPVECLFTYNISLRQGLFREIASKTTLTVNVQIYGSTTVCNGTPIQSEIYLFVAVLHVLFEGFSLWDGLSWIFIDLGLDFTGVVFATGGPAEFGGLFPVGLFLKDLGGELGLHGRGKGRDRADQGQKKDSLGLNKRNEE